MKNKPIKEIAIYQANGSIEFRGDFERETIWASQADLALLYEKDQSVISKAKIACEVSGYKVSDHLPENLRL